MQLIDIMASVMQLHESKIRKGKRHQNGYWSKQKDFSLLLMIFIVLVLTVKVDKYLIACRKDHHI